MDWSAALLRLTFSPKAAAAAALVAVLALLWIAAATPLPSDPKQFCTLQLGITSQRWQHQLQHGARGSCTFLATFCSLFVVIELLHQPAIKDLLGHHPKVGYIFLHVVPDLVYNLHSNNLSQSCQEILHHSTAEECHQDCCSGPSGMHCMWLRPHPCPGSSSPPPPLLQDFCQLKCGCGNCLGCVLRQVCFNWHFTVLIIGNNRNLLLITSLSG